MLFFLAKAEIY